MGSALEEGEMNEYRLSGPQLLIANLFEAAFMESRVRVFGLN